MSLDFSDVRVGSVIVSHSSEGRLIVNMIDQIVLQSLCYSKVLVRASTR